MSSHGPVRLDHAAGIDLPGEIVSALVTAKLAAARFAASDLGDGPYSAEQRKAMEDACTEAVRSEATVWQLLREWLHT